MKGIEELSKRARSVILHPKNADVIPAGGASGVWITRLEHLWGAGTKTSAELRQWISANNGREATPEEKTSYYRQRRKKDATMVQYEEWQSEKIQEAVTFLESRGYRVTLEEAFKEGQTC